MHGDYLPEPLMWLLIAVIYAVRWSPYWLPVALLGGIVIWRRRRAK